MTVLLGDGAAAVDGGSSGGHRRSTRSKFDPSALSTALYPSPTLLQPVDWLGIYLVLVYMLVVRVASALRVVCMLCGTYIHDNFVQWCQER